MSVNKYDELNVLRFFSTAKIRQTVKKAKREGIFFNAAAPLPPFPRRRRRPAGLSGRRGGRRAAAPRDGAVTVARTAAVPILTLLAFRRKMSYLCLSRGAGHRGLPLFLGFSACLRAKSALSW